MRRIGQAFATMIVIGTIGFGSSAAASSMVASMAPTKPVRGNSTSSVTGTIEDSFLTQELSGSFAAAQVFVRNAGLSRNLSLLLLEEVKNTAQVNTAIDQFGMDVVQLMVVQAIKSAHQSHEAAWTDVLAKVYSEHFTQDELASLMRDKEQSPAFIRLLTLQEKIGDSILTEGETVFSHARAEVMDALSLQLFQ